MAMRLDPRFAAATLIPMLLALPVLAQAPRGPDLSPLNAWVGNYPHDPKLGYVLENPALKARLEAILGKQAAAELLTVRGPEAPVQRDANWVQFFFCEAHNCGDNNVTVFAETAKGDVVVCRHIGTWLHAESRTIVTEIQFGPKPMSHRAPPGGCEKKTGEDDWSLLRRMLKS